MTRPNVAERNGYAREPYEFGGIRHDVYRGGDAGPVVLLLHELPSFSYRTVKLANHIRDHDYRIVMPILIGGIREEGSGLRHSLGVGVEFATSVLRICISWQFVALVQKRTSPITSWLLQLARDEAAAHGQRQVGVIGMCFSGGFALATAIDPVVGVAVASQPAMPFAAGPLGWIPGQSRDLGLSETDRLRLLDRKDDPYFCARAFRYETDWIAPAERVERIAREFAPGATLTTIPAQKKAHSVLTDATDRSPDESTRPALDAALASLIATLDERLKAPR